MAETKIEILNEIEQKKKMDNQFRLYLYIQ